MSSIQIWVTDYKLRRRQMHSDAAAADPVLGLGFDIAFKLQNFLSSTTVSAIAQQQRCSDPSSPPPHYKSVSSGRRPGDSPPRENCVTAAVCEK